MVNKMNNRYTFRGMADGKWYYGNLYVCSQTNHHVIIGQFKGDEEHLIDLSPCQSIEVDDPTTVGQCTGLSASKSYRGDTAEELLVYEGDILGIDEYKNGGRWIIKWSGGGVQFYAVASDGYGSDVESFLAWSSIVGREIGKNVGIIGTIHTHPELLEGDKE